jgi:hypothetical protein
MQEGYLIHAAGGGGTVGVKGVRLMEMVSTNFASLNPNGGLCEC